MAPFLSKSLGLKRLQGSNLLTKSNKGSESCSRTLRHVDLESVFSGVGNLSAPGHLRCKIHYLSRKPCHVGTTSTTNHVMLELSTPPLKVNGGVLRVRTLSDTEGRIRTFVYVSYFDYSLAPVAQCLARSALIQGTLSAH